MPLDRRDFLQLIGLGGAGAALGPLPGCRRPSLLELPVSFDGRLVGEEIGACHQVRDLRLCLPPQGAPFADEPLRDVVVVGGGLSGLAAAWALTRAGLDDFVVLERAAEPGGVSHGGSMAGLPCPWGAHYIGLPDPDSPVIMHFLSDVGVIQDFTPDGRPRIDPRYRVPKPAAQVFHGGWWSKGFIPFELASPRDVAEFGRFHADMRRWSRWQDPQGRPAFALPVAYASRAEEVQALDRLSFADYLAERRFRQPLLLWHLNNRMIDEYGCRVEEVSAYAAILYWAAEGGRRRAAKSDPRLTDYISWPEGNRFLVRRLTRLLPPRAVHARALVVNVQNHEDQVHVTVLEPRGTLRTYRGRTAIFAAPKLGIHRLVPGLSAAGRSEHNRLTFTPWMIANVLLDECPKHAARHLAWDNLIYRSWSLGFLNGNHFAQPARDPKHPFLLTLHACFAGPQREKTRRDLLELDWTFWARLVTDELSRVLWDVGPEIMRLDVWRWGHAMMMPKPGLLWDGARERLRAPLGRLFFAGNDVAGLPLYEEAVWAGVAAAEQALDKLGRSHRSLLTT